jgi:hypothetical protein
VAALGFDKGCGARAHPFIVGRKPRGARQRRIDGGGTIPRDAEVGDNGLPLTHGADSSAVLGVLTRRAHGFTPSVPSFADSRARIERKDSARATLPPWSSPRATG